MIFKETLITSLSFAVRDSRFPLICRAVPLSSSVFHAACALSAPAGHLPLEGKAAIRGYHPLKKGGEAATFISNSSFLIPNSSFPLYLIPQKRSVFSFAHFVSTSSETPMYCASALAT